MLVDCFYQGLMVSKLPWLIHQGEYLVPPYWYKAKESTSVQALQQMSIIKKSFFIVLMSFSDFLEAKFSVFLALSYKYIYINS